MVGWFLYPSFGWLVGCFLLLVVGWLVAWLVSWKGVAVAAKVPMVLAAAVKQKLNKNAS